MYDDEHHHNVRIWRGENPQVVQEHQRDSSEVNEWFSMPVFWSIVWMLTRARVV